MKNITISGIIILAGLFLTTSTILAAETPATPQLSYAQAYQKHQKTGKPLVVLVGAKWCPACQQMKTEFIPQALRQGSLKNVIFVTLDYDHNRKLASEIMKGGSIPQLVMYYKTETDSKRIGIVGAVEPNAISQFVHRGLSANTARIAKREKNK